MAARVPVLRQHHMRESRGQAIDQRHDLVAARHRQPAARTEVVLDVDDQQDVAIADRRTCSVIAGRFRCCARRSVDLGGELDQRVRHLDRIGCARFEPAQRLGQPLEIVRGPRADVAQASAGADAPAVLHHGLRSEARRPARRSRATGHRRTCGRPGHSAARPACGRARSPCRSSACGAAGRHIPGACRRSRAPARPTTW